MKYDVIIIGKGPAGISCAVYVKRYGYEPLIIAKDGGALAKVDVIENYYGFSRITGQELLEAGINQAKELGIEIVSEEVLSIDKMDTFSVHTKNNTYQSSFVVLACGTARSRFPLLDRFQHVSYCATCDGFFYRKKKVALIGNGSYMTHELAVLKQMCQEVIVLTNGLPLESDALGCSVYTEKIIGAKGETNLEAIQLENQTIEVDGCFIAIGSASGFTLAKHLGLALKDNFLIVNEQFETNLPGLYACGDVIGGLLQISKATSDGACCATALVKALKKA